MSTELTRDEVVHVARLARLSLTDEEVERFTPQLAKIIGHAADIASLDLGAVAPTAHPIALRNVFRSDEPIACSDRDEVLAAAPDVQDGRFKVPRIVGAAP
jgi:aspartyl-tRNA(Asn)/glutamyl-tRNA(Gln) amidotransferase subunit C